MKTKTFTLSATYKAGLDRVLLDGIQKTRRQIAALDSSKKHFIGDAAELTYKTGLLNELQRLYES